MQHHKLRPYAPPSSSTNRIPTISVEPGYNPGVGDTPALTGRGEVHPPTPSFALERVEAGRRSLGGGGRGESGGDGVDAVEGSGEDEDSVEWERGEGFCLAGEVQEVFQGRMGRNRVFKERGGGR